MKGDKFACWDANLHYLPNYSYLNIMSYVRFETASGSEEPVLELLLVWSHLSSLKLTYQFFDFVFISVPH